MNLEFCFLNFMFFLRKWLEKEMNVKYDINFEINIFK